jgi:hypothetical protein
MPMAKPVIRAAPTMIIGSFWEIRSLKADLDDSRLIGFASSCLGREARSRSNE